MDKDWTIDLIECLCEDEVKNMAVKKDNIKGHDIYFVTLGDFGFSALVFLNHHHIYYANDYELHHPGHSQADLEAIYREAMMDKLFTEQELTAPLKSYQEYKKKLYYIYNLYGMQKDNRSVYDRLPKSGMTYNPIGCRYYYDIVFVRHHIMLYEKLAHEHHTMLETNYEYIKGAFKLEMMNHEYYCNWNADYDTLRSFGNIVWRENETNALSKYFDDLHFSDNQRRAYFSAKKEYLSECDYY